MEPRDLDRGRGGTRRWWSVKKSTNERGKGSSGRLRASRRERARVRWILLPAIIDQKSVELVLVLVAIAGPSHRRDRDLAVPGRSCRGQPMPGVQEGRTMYMSAMDLSRRRLHQDNKFAAGVSDLEATCLHRRPTLLERTGQVLRRATSDVANLISNLSDRQHSR